jgi:hypothetical protein
MLPKFIETSADFGSCVTLGLTPETLVLEFKDEVKWKDRSPAAKESTEFCRDVAQFANTFGGVLLVGITEELDPATGLKRAKEIKRVEHVDSVIQWMEQAIKNYLVPSTFSRAIREIQTADGIVLAINIPASRHLVALWDKKDKGRIEYLYRTNHGKEWMNPDEMEAHIMNGSRAGRIAIERAMEELKVLTGGQATLFPVNFGEVWFAELGRSSSERIGHHRDHPTVLVEAVGDHAITVKFVHGSESHVMRVPYGLVEEAWLDAGHVRVHLRARVVMQGQVQARIVPNP